MGISGLSPGRQYGMWIPSFLIREKYWKIPCLIGESWWIHVNPIFFQVPRSSIFHSYMRKYAKHHQSGTHNQKVRLKNSRLSMSIRKHLLVSPKRSEKNPRSTNKLPGIWMDLSSRESRFVQRSNRYDGTPREAMVKPQAMEKTLATLRIAQTHQLMSTQKNNVN